MNVPETTNLMLPGRQQQVYDAAAKMAKPGECLSISELARAVGIRPNNAHLVIKELRKKGLWPYATFRRGHGGTPEENCVNRETTLIRDISAQLASLPDYAARKRVLDYVQKAERGG